MTCIAGLIDGGQIVIGGDSAGVAGYNITVRKDKKVFRNEEFVFGFTSSFRMGQLLQYAFQPPRRHPNEDVFGYMTTSFVDGVRDCFKLGGYARTVNDEEEAGVFLVGYEGRLFVIEADYQVNESLDGYAACGHGAPFAMGSLYSTQGRPAQERITTSLEAAQRFSAGVRAPFHIEILGEARKKK